MRLRTSLVSAITVVGLVVSPLALADPLDPDPSFGGDGTVKIDGSTASSTTSAKRTWSVVMAASLSWARRPGSSGAWSSLMKIERTRLSWSRRDGREVRRGAYVRGPCSLSRALRWRTR